MSLRSPRVRAAWLLLPAACLVASIAVILGGSAKVAFAQVLDQLRSVQTMSCKITTTLTAPDGTQQTSSSETIMGRQGEKRFVIHKVAPGSEDIAPMPANCAMALPRTACGSPMMVKLACQDQESCAVGPEDWLKRLVQVTDDADRQLGPRKIDGHDTLGFEVAGWKLGFGAPPTAGNPDSSGTLAVWVDVQSKLPVRMEVTATGWRNQPMHAVYEQFQWNVPVAALPELPGASEEGNALTMPGATEDNCIAGLQKYRDLVQACQAMVTEAEQQGSAGAALESLRQIIAEAGTGYPRRLDAQWFGPQVSALVAMRIGAQPAQLDPQVLRSRQEEGLQITAAALFYQKLVLDRHEPEYFGETVQPGDASAVLLRWQLPDGGTRVIYGDLHAETLPR